LNEKEEREGKTRGREKKRKRMEKGIRSKKQRVEKRKKQSTGKRRNAGFGARGELAVEVGVAVKHRAARAGKGIGAAHFCRGTNRESTPLFRVTVDHRPIGARKSVGRACRA
jgi:hypothetical protein